MIESTTIRLAPERLCATEGCERSASWPALPNVIAAFCREHTEGFFTPAWRRRVENPEAEGATLGLAGKDLTEYGRAA